MQFFTINATCRPQSPLKNKVKINKTLIAEGDTAKIIAKNRGWNMYDKVVNWWELEHSQCILAETVDGSIFELQSGY